MTDAVSIPPTPALGRFLPAAAGLAIAAHALVVAMFLLEEPQQGSGGGQVLGRMSVSLGNGGTSGETPLSNPAPPEQVVKEPVIEKPIIEEAAAAIVPLRPVAPPRDISDSIPKPPRISRETPANQPSAATGRPGAASAGAPTLGEGAPATTEGIGAADNRDGTARDAYLAAIRARIESNRIYPSAARREKAQGTVVLHIRIDGRGDLSASRTVGSSGSFHLDRAARRMVEKSAPFPRPPEAPFAATVPIAFTIR